MPRAPPPKIEQATKCAGFMMPESVEKRNTVVATLPHAARRHYCAGRYIDTKDHLSDSASSRPSHGIAADGITTNPQFASCKTSIIAARFRDRSATDIPVLPLLILFSPHRRIVPSVHLHATPAWGHSFSSVRSRTHGVARDARSTQGRITEKVRESPSALAVG